MSYALAVEKAWKGLATIAKEKRFSVALLSDTYDIDLDAKLVMSASCNVPAKDYVTILLLHYLAQKLALGKLPEPSGEWIDFNQLEGGEGYYPTFRKRTIEHVISKYGSDPDRLLGVLERMPAKKAELGDVSITIYPFKEVAILIKMSKADEEFGPDANILFDRNISRIFCTEDIVVITEMIIHQL